MSDQPPDARPAPPQGSHPTPSGATPSRGPGWRERMWSLPAMIAVALVCVILGGLGGAALASAADDGRDGRVGPGRGEVERHGQLRPPGKMHKHQRERWKELRREQRRQWRQDSLPSPARPTPSR